jgi:hypothetical protein
MRYPRSFNPRSIANVQFDIQILDTLKFIETLISIGFSAFTPQFNWILLIKGDTHKAIIPDFRHLMRNK